MITQLMDPINAHYAVQLQQQELNESFRGDV